MGQQCESDIDECSDSTDKCVNGATCVNTQGSYTCTCVHGYAGIYCEVCEIKHRRGTKTVNADGHPVCLKPDKLAKFTVTKKLLRSTIECFQFCLKVGHCDKNKPTNAYQVQKTSAGVMCHLVEYDGDSAGYIKADGCTLY
ncbi:cubilin homolog [Antedon mediterranea]|uniref:cubilin homolog n=1 Tax=Antedon mediterranea TaxID=105859 RepID=UPI003AF67F22